MNPDNFIELAKLSQDSLLNRRNYEWKVNFSLWSSIGIWTYFCLSSSFIISNISIGGLTIGYFLIAFIYIFLWQISIRKGFEADKQWKHFYMHSAEGLNPVRPNTSNPNIKQWNQLSYTLSQSCFTIALLLASFILIVYSKPMINEKQSSTYTIVVPDSNYEVVIKQNDK